MIAVPISFLGDRGVLNTGKGTKDGFVMGLPNGVTSGVYSMHMVEGAEVEVTT